MAKNQELAHLLNVIKFHYKITQKDIATKIGVTNSYLSDVLNERADFNNTLRRKLSEHFSGVNITGNNNTSVAGNANNVNCSSTIEKAIDEISAQRKLLEKSQEQIDRLLTIIEKLSDE